MVAAEIARLIPDARESKPGKYEAPCPTHGGRSRKGFAFEDSECGDRVLAICRAGCSTGDVLAALGLSLKDLYSTQHLDPNAQRRARAARGLEAWRSKKLIQASGLLRKLDRHAAIASELFAHYKETGNGTEEERDKAWESLAFGVPRALNATRRSSA